MSVEPSSDGYAYCHVYQFELNAMALSIEVLEFRPITRNNTA